MGFEARGSTLCATAPLSTRRERSWLSRRESGLPRCRSGSRRATSDCPRDTPVGAGSHPRGDAVDNQGGRASHPAGPALPAGLTPGLGMASPGQGPALSLSSPVPVPRVLLCEMGEAPGFGEERRSSGSRTLRAGARPGRLGVSLTLKNNHKCAELKVRHEFHLNMKT